MNRILRGCAFFLPILVLLSSLLVSNAKAYTWNSENSGSASIEGSYYVGIAEYSAKTLKLGARVIVLQSATAEGEMYTYGYATITGWVTGNLYWYCRGNIGGGGASISHGSIEVKFIAKDTTTGHKVESVVLHEGLAWSDYGTWRNNTMDIALYLGHRYKFSLYVKVHADVGGLGAVVADFGGIWWEDSKIDLGGSGGGGGGGGGGSFLR